MSDPPSPSCSTLFSIASKWCVPSRIRSCASPASSTRTRLALSWSLIRCSTAMDAPRRCSPAAMSSSALSSSSVTPSRGPSVKASRRDMPRSLRASQSEEHQSDKASSILPSAGMGAITPSKRKQWNLSFPLQQLLIPTPSVTAVEMLSNVRDNAAIAVRLSSDGAASVSVFSRFALATEHKNAEALLQMDKCNLKEFAM
mmetsp:Transcript_13336/g.33451  ORF Transcript_13336/g.33451 Transcript_13336/m.33451 type:complete len:200 (-) Transcript_13336:708-1307(-)